MLTSERKWKKGDLLDLFSASIPDSAEAVRRVAEEERADDATGIEERLRERRPPRVVANPVHLRKDISLVAQIVALFRRPTSDAADMK